MSNKVNNNIKGVSTDDIRGALYKVKDFIDDQLVDLALFEEGTITLEEFRERMNKKAEELDTQMEPMEVLQDNED